MKTGKLDCGCYISRIGHMPARIEFCNLHAAAPELLVATRILASLEGRRDLPADLPPKINQARAAIAKATQG